MRERFESLGNRVLILHSMHSVSMLAADVGVKGNCIYFSTDVKFDGEDGEAPWKVFNLGTGRAMRMTDVVFPNASQHMLIQRIVHSISRTVWNFEWKKWHDQQQGTMT